MGHIREWIDSHSKTILLLLALIMAGLFLAQIDDCSFWGDECYSVQVSRMSITELVKACKDTGAHPPLYYIYLKAICYILGYDGWVLHLSALIPYFLLIIISLTIFKNRFGCLFSAAFIVFLTMTPASMEYSFEVRGYSMAMFFLCMTYYYAGEELAGSGENRIHSILFVLFTLLSLYTEYYLAMPIFIIYTFRFIIPLCRKEKRKRKLICIETAASFVGYLPWLLTFFRKIEHFTNSFWLTWIPTMKQCLTFVYGHLCILILGSILFLLGGAFLLKNKRENKNSNENYPWNANDWLWALMGYLCVIGTILIATLISRIKRPLLMLRNIYPLTGVAWLSVLYSIHKSDFKKNVGKVLMTVLSCILLVCFLPSYHSHFQKAKSLNNETLSFIDDYRFSKDDVILTDVVHYNWTQIDYYYPETEHILIDDDLLESDYCSNKNVYILLSHEITENERLWANENFNNCTFVGSGKLGSNETSYVYKTGMDDQFIEDTTFAGCFFHLNGSIKEWFNPPLVESTPYQTIERYQGKPVNTMVYSIGNVVAGTDTAAGEVKTSNNTFIYPSHVIGVTVLVSPDDNYYYIDTSAYSAAICYKDGNNHMSYRIKNVTSTMYFKLIIKYT